MNFILMRKGSLLTEGFTLGLIRPRFEKGAQANSEIITQNFYLIGVKLRSSISSKKVKLSSSGLYRLLTGSTQDTFDVCKSDV